MTFLPKKSTGLWSVGCVLFMPFLFAIGMMSIKFYTNIPAGDTILLDMIARPGLSFPMLFGFASGIAAFILGLISLFKDKDYSVLVALATLIGFLDLLWVAAEIIFPH